MTGRIPKVLTGALVAALLASPAASGPDAPNVVRGTATVTGAGTSTVIVNQGSERAVVNWRSFNLNTGESIRFNQPGATSVILNRVTGNLGPSVINGAITANGRVFLINRDGILFGRDATINTASFLASTNDIRNRDFMAARYNFNIPGRSDASIVNLGTITATNGGFAALVAPGVRNSGTIIATLGTVALVSGNRFTLDFYGDKLITLAVGDEIAGQVRDVQTGLPLRSLVKNEGVLRANGGRVELTAAAARQIVDSVINNTGVIEATTVGTRNGMIVLGAATARTKPPGAPTQTVRVSGVLSATGNQPGTKGGKIVVTGESIIVTAADIRAFGFDGGGTVLIGGDWMGGNPQPGLVNNQSARLENFTVPTATNVTIDPNTRIDVSATQRGPGGKVVLWSDVQTTFAGTILARGGDLFGPGGFVEVSSKQTLTFLGNVDTRAPNGPAGTLLLDPYDVTINGADALGMFVDGVWIPTGNGSTISVATLVAQLQMGNVVITTSGSGTEPGDIFVNSGFNYSGPHTLTLSAHRNIDFDDAVITFTGAGNLVLRADSDVNNTGTVILGGTTLLDFSNGTGRISIFYNPPGSYTAPTDFSPKVQTNPNVPNQLTAYMLVNNLGDLENIDNNLNGTYALGQSINAVTFAGMNPGSTFTGVFEGNGHTISNLTLIGGSPLGLFPIIGTNGIVRNLNLANVTIIANASSIFMGPVAGINNGTVLNVHVLSGTVNGGPFNEVTAGGLVGWNTSFTSVIQSSSAATVTVGSSTGLNNSAGALVGMNTGLITFSFATGNVNGGNHSLLGGLVGRNDGTITFSTAFGAVNGVTGLAATFSTAIGGLVGFNTGLIFSSHAYGPVNGVGNNPTFSAIIGGLVGLNQPTGQIMLSTAHGLVTGSGLVDMGGFAGANFGFITLSHAYGNVLAATFGNVAGFVGTNHNLITLSAAFGHVVASGELTVGGFVAVNEHGGIILDSVAWGNVFLTNPGNLFDAVAGGFGGFNYGFAARNIAHGNVLIPGNIIAAGFFGANVGDLFQNAAYGSVFAGPNSVAAGFVGVNLLGTVFQSIAFGAVVAGDGSIVAGFSAINLGRFVETASLGPVIAGANSIVAGHTAINAGLVNLPQFNVPAGFGIGVIHYAYTVSPVIAGANSIVGGFGALNSGEYLQVFSAGPVNAGPGSTVGGLLAINQLAAAAFPFLLDDNNQPILPVFGQGVVTNGYWDRQTTGQTTSADGTGLTTAQLINGPPSGFDQSVWTSNPGSSYPYFPWQPGPAHAPTNVGNDNPPQFPYDFVRNVQQAALTPGDVVTILAAITPQAPRTAQPPAGQQQLPFQRFVDIPPLTETRFIANEVLLQIGANVTRERVEAIARQLGLTILTTENLSALGTTAYQFRIGSGQNVRDVIRAIANFGIHAGLQPMYVYQLTQQPDPQSIPPTQAPIGDPSQYVLGKLRIVETHRIARGTNVLVAVIDSEIDAKHPDLAAAIQSRFNATGVDEPPHTHGTGMAGAIVAQKRLLGTAPGARILAIRAFSTRAATAESTTLQILKGLDYAIKSGVRVINMSFAGPRDPSLSRQLKAAYDKGIVLIAAAGNAGPGSPPLFPAADESVIAVTATDVEDKIFSGANRGTHIAVSAPGVDILVPAPGDAYQMTTGTSVATAHVSGIVALMLERNPSLTPADVRRILTTSARKLGPNPRDDDFGFGLIDPLRALQAVPTQVVQPQVQPQRPAPTPANVPTPTPRRKR